MTHEETAKKLVDKFKSLDEPMNDHKHLECAIIAVNFALEPVESNIDGTIIFTHPTFAQAKELKEIRKAIELM